MGHFLSNVFATLTGIGLLSWTVWIFWTTNAQERLARTCAPVEWTGKLFTAAAMTAGSSESAVTGSQVSFDNTYYGCQFALWRVFYEEDWKREKAKAELEEQRLKEAASAHPSAKPQGKEH